jgi:hypothetical protein
MLAIVTLALGILVSHSGTPGEVVLRMLYPPDNPHATVDRTDISGRYATVLVRRGTMESSSIGAPVLLEHFSFGWQPIDILNDRFCPGEHGISARVEGLLMKGMPIPKNPGHVSCARMLWDFNDTGPAADVEAVRLLTRGPLVPSVHVWKNFAMGSWFGAGGGEYLYTKRAGSWKRVTGGGGAMGTPELRKYGVPEAAWCALRVYDATCDRSAYR